MVELGSGWAFYSMWFTFDRAQGGTFGGAQEDSFGGAQPDKGRRCLMIEPDPHKMNFGKLNFKLNKLSGTFDLGFISDQVNLGPSIPFYSVDYLMRKHGVEHLNILHSDIQGFELKMLEGTKEAMQNGKIDYFFISTHSNELHSACIEKLKSFDYQVLCEANLDESFSVDGLIVAKRSGVSGPANIPISKRS